MQFSLIYEAPGSIHLFAEKSGMGNLFILFVLSDTIPVFVVLAPLCILLQMVGLAGSRWPLILVYASINHRC